MHSFFVFCGAFLTIFVLAIVLVSLVYNMNVVSETASISGQTASGSSTISNMASGLTDAQYVTNSSIILLVGACVCVLRVRSACLSE